MLPRFYSYLSYFVLLYSFLHCVCFTIEELKSINYEVDILQTPVRKGEEQTLPTVQMTSIFGQEYQCVLPEVEEEEISEKITYNGKNSNIKELLQPMYSGNCLLKAKDWWTYELCFGQYIKQFHIEDGQIIGNVLTLGHYESDYDWSNETDQEKFKHVKQRYHSQYYVNGTKCDLTGQPRVAEVRIFCEEDSGDYIHRVDEPGTCSYVITVHTSRVCAHPQLKPLPSKKLHTVPCHPLLNEEQYSTYLEKLIEEKALADQKRNQWLNNQQERLKIMKNENLQSETKEYTVLKEFYKDILDDKQKEFKGDESSVTNKLKNEENEKNDHSSKSPLYSKNDESKEKEDEDINYINEYEKELEKLKTLLSPAKFAAVKNNIEEFYESVINSEDEGDLSGGSEEKDNSFIKLFKLLRKLDKAERDIITAKKDLEKVKSTISRTSSEDSSETSESDIGSKINKDSIKEDQEKQQDTKADSEDNDLKVRIRRLDQIHSSGGKVYEIDEMQQKKLERAIKEKLEKYGVNTGGRRIEVKIIKAGYYDGHLTDEEASQFENMITALLTGEQEAIQEMERNKKLEENYKFTWNNENQEVEEE